MSDDLMRNDPENPLANIPMPSTSEAFLESEVMFWNEKKLHPFDVMRRSAAYAMGLRYDRWRAEDIKELRETGVYSSLPNDVVIVLFVCSTPKLAKPVKRGDGEEAYWENPITVPKIFSDPEAAVAAAYEWAEREGMDFTGEGLPVATAIFSKIMRQIDRSKFKVIEKTPGVGTPAVSAEASPNA